MKKKQNQVCQIASEMGIDAEEIAQRKAFHEFNDKDRDLLHFLDKKLTDFQETFIDKFYHHVLQFEEMRSIIPDETSLAKLEKSQSIYFKSLTKGQYDWDYVLNRLQVGLTHQRVGMSAKWYIGAYRKYLSLLLEHIGALPGIDRQSFIQYIDSIIKIVFFDMGLAIDTYVFADNKKIKSLEMQMTELIQGVDGFIWEFDVTLNEYLFVSPQSETILGYYPSLWSERPEFRHQIVHPDDRERIKVNFNRILTEGDYQDIEYRIIVNNGESLWVNERITAVKNDEGKVSLLRGLILDIDKHKNFEKRLDYLTSYDELTELPNRTYLQNNLIKSVSDAKRKKYFLGLMFIDLDGFKSINDSLGHTVGDKFLRTIGNRFKENLIENEFAARWGGDEFCIIIENIIEDQYIANIASRCLKLLEKPIYIDTIDTQKLYPRASIGISIFPRDGDTPEKLLQCAENAMYAAKATGRHQFVFFNKEMTINAKQRLALENDLRQALKREEFELYYQPQIELNTGKLIAVEALIRWHHPFRGMIPPDQFIPVMEEMGLIIPLGVWVLNQACKQMAEWRQCSVAVEHIAVNISSSHFYDGSFPEDILLALINTKLQPCDIELEITESVCQLQAENKNNIQSIKDIGVKIAIDDFGTGYSCLSSLTELPIDNLKIDKAFIQHVLSDSHKTSIVETIIAMSRALGFSVVAEGVETIEQVAYLQSAGCDIVQGFYFSKPVPADKIPKMANTGFVINST